MHSTPQLEPNEPLSPELVLVLPPELRALAIAALGPPAWPTPRPKPRLRAVAPRAAAVGEAVELSASAPVREPFGRSFVALVAARAVQLAVIFLAVTAVTLAMSLVAHAVR